MDKNLLAYCWKHKLATTQNQDIEIIDGGLMNNRERSVMFFNSKVKVKGTLWVGYTLILEKASDWYLLHWDTDKMADSIVLVAVGEHDSDIIRASDKEYVPMLDMEVPEAVTTSFEEIISDHTKCWENIKANVSTLVKHAYIAALQTESLENMVETVRKEMQGKTYRQVVAYTTVFVRLLNKVKGITVDEDALTNLSDKTNFGFDDCESTVRHLKKYIKHVNGKPLNSQKVAEIMGRAYVPVSFAYGRSINDEGPCDLAFYIMEVCYPERTEAVKRMKGYGFSSPTLGDSMGVNALMGKCMGCDCINCRFALAYIKNKMKG